MKAAVSMIDAFYGGHLSQDRIAYYAYHEYLKMESPQNDLGHGKGIVGLNIVNLLSWALDGESIVRIMGKPGFDEIKYWIDLNIPVIRDNGESHFITVIDGYDTNGEMVYVIDPLTGTINKISYASLDVFVMWIVFGESITARSDEPTIWMDSDSDGVIDFDEIDRFHTDPYSNDTWGIGMDDKAVIKNMYINHLTFPTARFEHSPIDPSTNEQIVFNASQSSGNIAAYTWSFDDNNITAVTTPAISHSYNQPGTYNVTLTVSDQNGLWNITRSLLTVESQSGPPEAFGATFYRQSLDRKGYAMTDGPNTPDIRWTISLNSSITTSPVVAEGKIFVGTSEGRLCTLDLATGTILWTLDLGIPISSSFAFQNGTVFFGTQDPGKIYAVDAVTGLAKWSYPIPSGAAVYSSPAVIDNKVIAGSSDGYLTCLDEFESDLLWSVHLNGGYISSPAIQNNTVFVTSNYGVHAVNLLTGALVWEYSTSWPVTSCPAIADGLVFVGSENDDTIYAFEQSTGNLIWSFRTGGWLTPPAVDSLRQLVIVGSKDYRLYCLDERTGSLKWNYINGPYYPSDPTITQNGLVYLGTSNGSLCCVNETTGVEIWKCNLNAPIVASATAGYEHLVVGVHDGRVYCFGPNFAVHNIAVTNLTLPSCLIGQGDEVNVSVTVENHGDYAETFNVTIYANNTVIQTNNIALLNGSSTITTFVWNTTGFTYGNYTLYAYATSVQGETDTTDNKYANGIVRVAAAPYVAFNYSPTMPKPNELTVFDASASYKLEGTIISYAWDFGDGNTATVDQPVIDHEYTRSGEFTVTLNVTDNEGLWNRTVSSLRLNTELLGDINGDGTIDIYDAVLLANAYNSNLGDPNWNANADLNRDNTVDILDAILLANHFGESM